MGEAAFWSGYSLECVPECDMGVVCIGDSGAEVGVGDFLSSKSNSSRDTFSHETRRRGWREINTVQVNVDLHIFIARCS